jgi:hypothetical protein
MPAAGLLARGSMPPFGLPGANGSSGRWKGARRLQLRGQPRISGEALTAFPIASRLMREPSTRRTIVVSPRFAREGGDDTLTKAAMPALSASHIDGLSDERNRERGKGACPKSAAAPATVSGEPEPNSHWEGSREGGKAETREPGDLPSMLVARRAGCLGAVGSLADWSGFRASAVMHP